MSVWGILAGFVEPVTKLIDNLHTSDQEKMEIKANIFQMQSSMAAQMLDYEKRLMEMQTQIITAEAKGQSWIQRNWRPITMLTFLVLVILDTMGWTEFRLSDSAWTLLQIGLGGYVGGRTIEKITPQITQLFHERMGKDKS